MKPFLKKLGHRGQASVEYILLIVIMITISISVFAKLEGYLLTNPDSFKNRYLGAYKNMFGGNNGSFQSQYKWFTIRR